MHSPRTCLIGPPHRRSSTASTRCRKADIYQLEESWRIVAQNMSSEADVGEIESQKSSSHPPPSSLSSRSSSVDPNAINIGTNSPENGPINIPITVDDEVQQNRSPTPSAATASVAVAVPPPSKPKSIKHRPRSPSPSPPPPPPPLRTIRLDIRLGGPENYEVDISGRAKETGQRPNTPIPTGKATVDSSDSEGDDEGAAHKKKVRGYYSGYFKFRRRLQNVSYTSHSWPVRKKLAGQQQNIMISMTPSLTIQN